MGRGDGVTILLTAGTVWAFVHIFAVRRLRRGRDLRPVPTGSRAWPPAWSPRPARSALTVGIPLLSAIAAARFQRPAARGRSASDGLLSGIHLALGVDAAILLAVAARCSRSAGAHRQARLTTPLTTTRKAMT